ncbi:MAG: hypothetical protein V1913_18820 [Fibrobacterota bacterium]
MKKPMFHSSGYLMLILALLMVARSPSQAEITLTPFSYQDCKRFIKGKTFASKEELIQLFYEIYKADTIDNIMLTRETILKLKKDIKTYFPLKSCKAIRLTHHELTLLFDHDLVIPIPGMWRQVKLYMPREVVFFVSRFPEDSQAVRFKLKKGYVNVHTSRLAKQLNPFAVDIYGFSFIYKIDYTRKHSTIGLEELDYVPMDRLSFHQTDTGFTVATHHNMANRDGTLTFRPQRVQYFGYTASLIGKDSICYNNRKTEKDRASNMAFRNIIDAVGKNPKNAFKNGLTKTITVMYNLEASEGTFYQGFVFGKK